MNFARKAALPLAAALVALGLLVVPSSAMATHARPYGATPSFDPLVTAMKPCTAAGGDPAGMTHAPTWSFKSCQVGAPGTIGGPISTNISFGSPGSPAQAPAQGSGYLRLCTSFGCGQAPTLGAGGGDAKIELVITDVRCTGSTACSAPGSNGPQTTQDYTGRVSVPIPLQITDHNNGTAACPPTCTTSATVTGFVFTVLGACAENTGTGVSAAPIGGTCTVNTTISSLCPAGCLAPGKLANIERGAVDVFDGGIDGDPNTADSPNLRAFTQGFLVP